MTATLLHGDCLALLPTLESESVDAVIADPPYGIGYASAWQTRMGGGPRRNQASFGSDVFDPRWIPLVYEVMKPSSFLYCFTRWDVLNLWREAFEDAGFAVAQRLVWDKAHWKMGDLRYYGSQTEDVLVCRKGKPILFPGGIGRRGNLFRVSSSFLPEGQVDHPTQKPVSLVSTFVLDSSHSGATVLDPFMGSGTTGVACVQTGRHFIGIEIEQSYFDIARVRIAAAEAQARLRFDEVTP